MNVKFGVFSDLHSEFIHDSVKRTKKFIEACKEQSVDFMAELGDFCPPGEINLKDKQKILKAFKDSNIPFHHALGNHDMDQNVKSDVIEMIDSPSEYYSFDIGGIHFVMLDTCYYRVDDEDISYEHGNYTHQSDGKKVSVLPRFELEWLKTDLANARFPAILFSHHSLIESRSGITNAGEFRDAIKDAPYGVLMCICGHEHLDRLEKKDGTYYLCINSMTYYWAGSNYAHTTYGEEIEREYPMLTKVFPYRDPLYAIISINDNEISIEGTKSEIVGNSPDELKFVKKGLIGTVSACIEDKVIKINQL